MPFVATANPPQAAQEAKVVNDGFWPDMDPAQVRSACRLDGTVTADRLLPALQAAMLTVNAELRDWRERQLALGHAKAGDAPAARLGGKSVQVLHYRRAVHACPMRAAS
jgi:hypothetical protein